MEAKLLWEKVLGEFLIVSDDVALAKQWLSQTQGISLNNNVLTVICPHFYTRDLILKKHKKTFTEILTRLTQEKIRLEIIIQTPKIEKQIKGPLFDQLPTLDTPIHDQTVDNKPLTQIKPLNVLGLNSGLTFENFVVGSCNRLAHAAAISVCENPGQAYNPLFIFGGTGLGKTHLLQSIGNELAARNPNLRIRYFTSEKFVNDLVEAIRFKKDLREFRGSYRLNDTILVDDIQFLVGKESSQEEFFNTFNELQNTNKQIVLASDKAPKEINGLPDRLTSRFLGGLTLQLGVPDFETRLAIIKTKADILNLNLDNETALFLAEIAADNVREIEGLLQKVKAQALLSNQPISQPLIENLLNQQKNAMVKNKNITPEKVINLVAQNFNTSFRELCAKTRKKEIVLPRQLTMYLLRKDLHLGLAEIGQTLGGRDHSTVLHATGKIEEGLKNGNAFIKSTLSNLRQNLF